MTNAKTANRHLWTCFDVTDRRRGQEVRLTPPLAFGGQASLGALGRRRFREHEVKPVLCFAIQDRVVLANIVGVLDGLMVPGLAVPGKPV